MTIESLHAREILDSRGNPTVEVEVVLADGTRLAARKLVLATGVVDELPRVPGVEALYGRGVFHCPYCDGWEHRDRNVAVIGRGSPAAALALALKTWTSRVMLCTDGARRMRPRDRHQLAGEHIEVRTSKIARVDHDGPLVRAVTFADGRSAICEAIFFSGSQYQQCDLAARLGCKMNRRGVVKTGNLGQTHLPGLYVVGDASRDVQFAIVAAAEGAKAAVAINKALQVRAGLSIAPQEIDGRTSTRPDSPRA
jgi:thioredoxin reductase